MVGECSETIWNIDAGLGKLTEMNTVVDTGSLTEVMRKVRVDPSPRAVN